MACFDVVSNMCWALTRGVRQPRGLPPEAREFRRRGGGRHRRAFSRRVPRQGRAVQVDPIKPKLKAPRTDLLTPKYDKLLSSLPFKFNLRRYIKATHRRAAARVKLGLLEAGWSLRTST